MRNAKFTQFIFLVAIILVTFICQGRQAHGSTDFDNYLRRVAASRELDERGFRRNHEECSPQISCGACSRGVRHCNVISCSGSVSDTYSERCEADPVDPAPTPEPTPRGRPCTPQIRCGSCSDRGVQHCNVIDCDGSVSATYAEACTPPLPRPTPPPSSDGTCAWGTTYNCGPCQNGYERCAEYCGSERTGEWELNACSEPSDPGSPGTPGRPVPPSSVVRYVTTKPTYFKKSPAQASSLPAEMKCLIPQDTPVLVSFLGWSGKHLYVKLLDHLPNCPIGREGKIGYLYAEHLR